MKAEVPWIQMWHMGAPVPRLVHIQGDREIPSAGVAGCTYTPLYRHPTDLSPAVEAWTPAVRAIAQLVSKKLGRTYNQALVQLYRSGKDAISEHADKTLDIEHGAPIVGVSLGASRTFTLRSKARLKANTGPQSVQHIALPDSSVYVLGLETNRTFTHQIAADKNPPGNRRPDENAFGGERISITLRCVASYLRSDGRVFGQGAPHKSEAALEQAIAAGDAGAGRAPTDRAARLAEEARLRQAFHDENKHELGWEEVYGTQAGFEILGKLTARI